MSYKILKQLTEPVRTHDDTHARAGIVTYKYHYGFWQPTLEEYARFIATSYRTVGRFSKQVVEDFDADLYYQTLYWHKTQIPTEVENDQQFEKWVRTNFSNEVKLFKGTNLRQWVENNCITFDDDGIHFWLFDEKKQYEKEYVYDEVDGITSVAITDRLKTIKTEIPGLILYKAKRTFKSSKIALNFCVYAEEVRNKGKTISREYIPVDFKDLKSKKREFSDVSIERFKTTEKFSNFDALPIYEQMSVQKLGFVAWKIKIISELSILFEQPMFNNLSDRQTDKILQIIEDGDKIKRSAIAQQKPKSLPQTSYQNGNSGNDKRGYNNFSNGKQEKSQNLTKKERKELERKRLQEQFNNAIDNKKQNESTARNKIFGQTF